ncbi:hypothetical protein [Soonwooa sp.]|uniref:hypothetical protein n=1 Tax=Soonwooa sp. TaxID=1938592 RepID=UPI00289631C9|nr:hypothetical protein [Soonwooa sp.]
MRKELLLIMTFVSSVLFSQYRDYDNRFNQENPVQRENNFRKAEVAEEIETRDQELAKSGPGGPGEPPSPINNALPLLGVVAISLIIAQQKLKKKTNNL